MSPRDPSLRCLCPCPAALANPGCAFHGFSRLLPPGLAPCLPVQEASLPLASQNSWPAEALIDPSRCILSETNRFPRSLTALDLAGRTAAGLRAPQERRVGVVAEGKLGREQLLTPLVAAAFRKSLSPIKQIEVRRMTFGKFYTARRNS